MVLTPFGQGRGHDRIAEVFAYGTDGFRHAHSCLGSLGGFDDRGGEELVFDLEDFGQTRDLVGLKRGQHETMLAKKPLTLSSIVSITSLRCSAKICRLMESGLMRLYCSARSV
jgi:hypothetical protein